MATPANLAVAKSRECLRCHNSWCGFVLGFNAPQLIDHTSTLVWLRSIASSLQTLAALRVTDSAPETGPPASSPTRAVLKPI